jgi:alpha-L-rhamnosidase
MNRIYITFILFLITFSTIAQPFVRLPEQLNDDRFAEWIGPAAVVETGVFYFRKAFDLVKKPEKFVVHVSADNRYRLFVNGEKVSFGPAIGDIQLWNYETVDLAPHLKAGRNIVAAQVWNLGPYRGVRQITVQTAFILQGESEQSQLINTNDTWKVKKDTGYYFLHLDYSTVGGGYIAGATDSLIAKAHPWGWETLRFDDTSWDFAKKIGKGNHSGLDTWKGTPWFLQASPILPLEQKKEKTPALLSVHGVAFEPDQYNGQLDVTIPPNQKAEMLFDNRVLTMGFPYLVVSGGKGSKIKIQYQEALFNENGQKDNRDDWRGKTMKGYYDIWMPDGEQRIFVPLWIRVFRYVKITVETGSEALNIHDFYNLFTAYPLQQNARFESGKNDLKRIWDTSWRTVRLCALETYMDCPYYEQIQYIGDTRIQSLISLYVDGDDRMMKNAIRQFNNSMQPMGLTKSSHPNNSTQIIPPFSLIYINMLHDYHMHRSDSAFIRNFIPGMKFILSWFINRIDETGMLGPLPYWNHIDGGTLFTDGSPPGITEGNSAHMSILLAYTLDHAVELLEFYDDPCDVDIYRERSETLKKSTIEMCFDNDRGLLAETPDKNQFSQHTQSMAILADMFDQKQAKLVAQTMMEDTTLIQATLYFRFYLFQALDKAGLGDLMLDNLDNWKFFLEKGFTTFPEHGLHSRSDCHAWSAHPMYDFLSITCGIKPSGIGFETVLISPQLGNLARTEASMPHPLGTIEVRYEQSERNLDAWITLPKGLTGTFKYLDQRIPIQSGEQKITIKK